MTTNPAPQNPTKPPVPAAKPAAGAVAMGEGATATTRPIAATARPAAPQSAGAPAARPANRPGVPVQKAPAPAGQQALAAKAQPAQSAEGGDEEAASPGIASRFLMFNAVPSWLISMIVHVVAILLMALITIATGDKRITQVLTIGPEKPVEEIEEFKEEQFEEVQVNENILTSDISPQPETQNIAPEPVLTPANDLDAAPVRVELNPLGDRTAPKNDLLAEVGAYSGSGVDGRGEAARAALVASAGGSAGSEEAVARALKWFAEHQNYVDGSWCFDHTLGPCQGRCRNPGSIGLKGCNGATAMALLPFLGAGQTHKEGKYRDNVHKGLAYLVRNMKVGPTGGALNDEGTMYAHGLSGIALCEAYAMTHDRELMAPAQAAINFIVYAQDPVGGGWRYQPRTPGDTSVVGWQLMALKSGHMAYLMVPKETIQGAIKFLDSVESDSGAKYGYTAPGAGSATTAIGLLCRMYLGWKHDHPAIERGVEFLDKTGPSKTNMYFNYYATQVMRHYEGDPWKRWNDRMRDWLVDSQSKAGHEEGSWWISDGHGQRGGRLYITSMSTMILEVYYRHLPIYRKQASEEDFPL